MHTAHIPPSEARDQKIFCPTGIVIESRWMHVTQAGYLPKVVAFVAHARIPGEVWRLLLRGQRLGAPMRTLNGCCAKIQCNVHALHSSARYLDMDLCNLY